MNGQPIRLAVHLARRREHDSSGTDLGGRFQHVERAQHVGRERIVQVEARPHHVRLRGKVIDDVHTFRRADDRAVIAHIVGCRLGPQQPVVADVLLGEAVRVMAANDRVGKIEIFDDSLQFAFVFLGHFAAEDDRDLLRLTDGPIHVQQALLKFIHSCAPEKDQVVAVLGLSEE